MSGTSATQTKNNPFSPQTILLALGFIVILIISAASIWLVDQSNEDSEAVARTLEAQNKLSFILLYLRRAESAQRGYLITGENAYLTEYRDSAANALPALENARAGMFDSEGQRGMLAAIEPLIRQKIAEMERTVALVESNQREAALALVRTGEGRQYMEQIRDIVSGMLDLERRQFTARAAASSQTGLWSVAVTLIGSALILIFAGVLIYIVRRTGRQREEARSEVEDANANLEQTVAERTADLSEANEEIQRFAYIVSHDLRSPLVNVMGFTSELETLKKDIFERLAPLRGDDQDEAKKDSELASDFDESFRFIKSSISKMDRLINSILKLSREGRREFHPEYVSMDKLLTSIANSLEHQASEADAKIVIESLPPLKSDRLALEQIFSNLVDNAVKYLKSGQPGLVRIHGRTTPTQVIYEVADNGRGIAPEDHQRIYDLFRRAGQQDRAGEGIGLAHVRALVRRLGGYMTLKSELGQGSTFTVTLPRRWVDEEERKSA